MRLKTVVYLAVTSLIVLIGSGSACRPSASTVTSDKPPNAAPEETSDLSARAEEAESPLEQFESRNAAYRRNDYAGVEEGFFDDWTDLAKETGTPGDVIAALEAHAYFLQKNSKLGAALNFIHEALQLVEENPSLGAADKYVVYLRLAAITLLVGRLPEAEVFLRKALDVLPPLESSKYARTWAKYQGQAERELGWVLYKMGQKEQALQQFKETYATMRRYEVSFEKEIFLDRWASLLKSAGAYSQARARYLEAIRLSRAKFPEDEMTPRNKDHLAVYYHNLAELEVRTGHIDRAKAAFETIEKLIGLQDLGINERAAFYRTQALIRHAEGRSGEAINLLETSLQELRQARRDAGGGTSQIGFDSERHHLFVDPLIFFLIEDGRIQESLQTEDNHRARWLREELSKEGGPGIPQEYLEEEEGIMRELAELEFRRQRRPGDGLTPEITRRQSLLRNRLGRVKSQINAELRKAYSSRPAQPLDLEAIQAEVLGDETLVLYYALGSHCDYLWLIGSDFVEGLDLGETSRLRVLVEDFHKKLNPDQRPSEGPPLREMEELSRILLFPALDRLREKQVVLVVPDEVLTQVPFHALPHPGEPSGDYKPLLQTHQVAYAPSLATLASLHARAFDDPPEQGLIAVLGDPIYELSDERLDSVEGLRSSSDEKPGSRPFIGRKTPRLPFSQSEALGIKKIALQQDEADRREVRVRLGVDANRELFMSGGLDDFEILHLATHAVAHPIFPEFSYLILSQYRENGTSVSPYLRVAEIARRPLKADLIVLSACRTATGSVYRGEGVVGLTQSFFAAGVQRAVVSLWDVDDKATSRLMELFYDRLLNHGLPAVESLRQAQMELSTVPEYAGEPYFWAGFVLQGNFKEN